MGWFVKFVKKEESLMLNRNSLQVAQKKDVLRGQVFNINFIAIYRLLHHWILKQVDV